MSNSSGTVSQGEISAFLGQGTSFNGRLLFEGTVRIDGTFVGDIYTRDTLIVGPEARVRAQIDADTVVVAGVLEGEVRALGRVEIQSTGVLRGQVISPVLKIEEGGMFEGRTQMQASPENPT